MSDQKQDTLLLKLLSPTETLFDGEAYSVSAIDKNGSFDILPGHENFIALLTIGNLRIKTSIGNKSFGIHHGIMQVTDNIIEVYVNV